MKSPSCLRLACARMTKVQKFNVTLTSDSFFQLFIYLAFGLDLYILSVYLLIYLLLNENCKLKYFLVAVILVVIIYLYAADYFSQILRMFGEIKFPFSQ